MFTLDNTLGSNMSLLEDVPKAYTDFKDGKISKGQYDYLRKSRLDQYTRNVGPVINKLIYGDDKPHKSMRIKPNQTPMNATKPLTQHMDKLTRVSKAASRGGLVLTGVGLAASCYQISQTENVIEKNEITVSTLASTGTGLAAGIVASALLVGTPIGWTIILGIGTVSALTSWGVGEFSGSLYKTYFSDKDIVNSLGINKLCN